MTKSGGHFGNQILSQNHFLPRWETLGMISKYAQDRSRDWQCPNNNCTLPQLGADITNPAGPSCLAILEDPKVEKETLSSDQSASSVVRLGHSIVQSTIFFWPGTSWIAHRVFIPKVSPIFFCYFLFLCPSSVCSGTGGHVFIQIPGQQEKCKELLSHRHHLALHCMGWLLG